MTQSTTVTIEEKMFQLLATALDGREDIQLDSLNIAETDWLSIRSELEIQSVRLLPAMIISNSDLSSEVLLENTKRLGRNIKRFYSIMNEQDRLVSLLESVGIQVAVLKGAAAASAYPKPDLRQMGDIDIIVKPADFSRAFVLLNDSGYRLARSYTDNSRHAGFVSDTGCEIELHKRFSSSNDKNKNKILDDCIYSGLEQIEHRDVCGYSVPLLPPIANGIVLLGHIAQHLSSGLGFRQIFDWFMFVKKYLSDDLWYEEFCPLAERVGLKKLAEVTTLMCKQHFGLRGITWCDHAESALAEELLQYVLKKGNFGKKESYGTRKSVFIMHKLSNPVTFFRYLTANGIGHWKAAQKYRFLRPFAWIYQIGHLTCMWFKRRAGFRDLHEEMKQSQAETVLLSELGVPK